MAKVPLGNAARATRRVASGIGCSSSGRNDIRLLLPALVGAGEQPNRSADQGPAEFATSVSATCRRTRADHVDGSRSRGRVRHDAVAAGASNRSGANPMQGVTIGLDLAKSVFQVHGVAADGTVA